MIVEIPQINLMTPEHATQEIDGLVICQSTAWYVEVNIFANKS